MNDEQIQDPVFQIDPELVRRWSEIDPSSPINIEMPRVALDMLYTGVSNSYFVQLDIITALQKIRSGEDYDLEEFNRTAVGKIVQGLNGIRHFQNLIMAEATNSSLNADGSVGDQEVPDDE